MDLKINAPDPTATERSAVDALLEGQRPSRDLLLPVLQAVQGRVGWVSEAALGHICGRLEIPPAEAYGVLSFYHLLAARPQPSIVAHVCDDLACRLHGAEKLCAELSRGLGPEGVTWRRSSCLGHCERAPAALVVATGEKPATFTVAPASLDELTAGVAVPARATRSVVRSSVPQAGTPGLRLLGRVGVVDPECLAAYRSSGGYQALARALALGREATLAEVIVSGLCGRGGAAFPTGRKWEAVARQTARPHFVVLNADESEPGTFKDRVLMEEDPFAVLEGMTIAAFAAGCERGFIYLRGEYPLAAARMATAVLAARTAGLLGPRIMGADFAFADFSFDVEIRRGAGAYVCGEETALFESIEGRRGEPRPKPPFPVEAGLFGQPTVVNNVETLAMVPLILRQLGADAKLFCVSGQVARPGVFELPLGTPFRDLLALAGCVHQGRQFRAALVGGATGTFITADHLDVLLSVEGLKAIGVSLGSGAVLVLDETADVFDLLRRIAVFFRDESCGKCVPCRVGTERQVDLLDRVRTLGVGAGLLGELGQAMREASICGLGQAASLAIESASARQLLDPRSLIP